MKTWDFLIAVATIVLALSAAKLIAVIILHYLKTP